MTGQTDNSPKFAASLVSESRGRKKKSGESATDPQPCPAKLFFYSESEIHLETSHNHEPNAGEPEALDTKTGIKRKAEEQPLTPTQTIITEALYQSSPCHHKSHRADYILPEEATTTVDDQNFLIHDEPGSESRRLGTGNSKTGTLTPCVMRSPTFGRVVLPDFWASCKSSQEPNQSTLSLIGCRVISLGIWASCPIPQQTNLTG